MYREVISFIDRGMGRGKKFVVRGVEYHLSLECRKPTEELPQYNLEINAFHRSTDVRATILGQYNVSSITIDEIRSDESDEENFDAKIFQLLVVAINSNENELQAKLLKIILGRWGSNSLRRNMRVDRFFTPNDIIYTGIRVVEGSYVLVFSKSRSKAMGETGTV